MHACEKANKQIDKQAKENKTKKKLSSHPNFCQVVVDCLDRADAGKLQQVTDWTGDGVLQEKHHLTILATHFFWMNKDINREGRKSKRG